MDRTDSVDVKRPPDGGRASMILKLWLGLVKFDESMEQRRRVLVGLELVAAAAIVRPPGTQGDVTLHEARSTKASVRGPLICVTCPALL